MGKRFTFPKGAGRDPKDVESIKLLCKCLMLSHKYLNYYLTLEGEKTTIDDVKAVLWCIDTLVNEHLGKL